MRIGILGGGQLGRMLAIAGYPLGMRFRVFDPAVDATAGHLAELVSGDYYDIAFLDRFARDLDRVTWEFENVPVATARRLAETVQVAPPPAALEVAQDRVNEKSLFRTLGFDTADFVPVASAEELEAAISTVGLPAIVKTRRQGYDGKGQALVLDKFDVQRVWDSLGGAPCIVEARIPFSRELSLIAVRGRDGTTRTWPWVENTHIGGILRHSRAPAEPSDRGAGDDAVRRTRSLLNYLGYIGVLAVEFFEHDGRLLANEMAPRVHNSGHWTIEGAVTSQFENHLRAVADLPLGSTEATGHAVMVNLIGQSPSLFDILAIEGVHAHLYDKLPRPGRKVGHMTAVAATAAERDEAQRRLTRLIDELP